MINPTGRFSTRVENYVKYRPGYPQGVRDLLRDECGLNSSSVIADVGSGTGILSEMFLKNGNTVYGVEPNREMREAGERLLSAYSNFKSIEGTAEATSLGDASFDFIIAGQAFHWFDRERARREFLRILKPGGWTAFLWNERRTDTTPFLVDYERMLIRCGTDYEAVNHTNISDEVIASFFAPSDFRLKIFDTRQIFDFESLKGRLLSSSYTPEEGHPNYKPMLDELERIFREHEAGGEVAFEYDTKIYYGQLEPRG
ncbi:MAG: methyltransferase domain-containing protein [Pyrinomonadaceae bacterium]|nr:methyltransferase domain-containing protein [Pyrinomonadaceae bacterium]